MQANETCQVVTSNGSKPEARPGLSSVVCHCGLFPDETGAPLTDLVLFPNGSKVRFWVTVPRSIPRTGLLELLRLLSL